jgi:hypothetical protein
MESLLQLNANSHVLPDSRLREKQMIRKSVVATPDGGKVTVEEEPVYCINCGKLHGWVIVGAVWEAWLCTPCAETWGKIAGTYMMPDELFWILVACEMLEHFGRYLTNDEIVMLARDEDYGPLRSLAMDSPIKIRGFENFQVMLN